jgi:MFS family permease
VWDSACRRGFDLQRRGPCGHGRADRLRAPWRPVPRKRVLVLGLLAQAFGALAYVFAPGLGEFYTVAAIFGFIYAGVMPLYAVLARENFPLRMMGTAIGGTAMAGSLVMALGPLAGGLIYDALTSYTWLYVGS